MIKNGDKKKISKTQQQEQIVLYMKQNSEYKLQDFCELLNLKESRIKTIIKPLIEAGVIACVGANKDRRYLKGRDK
jgi:DNA-binding MarR family transcriptional regulator